MTSLAINATPEYTHYFDSLSQCELQQLLELVCKKLKYDLVPRMNEHGKIAFNIVKPGQFEISVSPASHAWGHGKYESLFKLHGAVCLVQSLSLGYQVSNEINCFETQVKSFVTKGRRLIDAEIENLLMLERTIDTSDGVSVHHFLHEIRTFISKKLRIAKMVNEGFYTNTTSLTH